MKQPRNRKAQDLTLINLEAMKKRLARLEARVKLVERRVTPPIAASDAFWSLPIRPTRG